MFPRKLRFGFYVVALTALATAAWAQTTAIEGDVKDETGQPMKGAQMKIDRKDIKGNYKVKTDKKGHYFYGGLPLGNYKVTVEIDGKDRDSQDNVKTTLGDPRQVNFDLKQSAERSQALAKAAETGTLTQEQSRELTPEQKAAIEKRGKENAAVMAKNKQLNDAFNQGKEALLAKSYPAAIDAFEKASQMDPNQHVIWGNLAETYVADAATKTGADQTAEYEKGLGAFGKAIALQPEDPAYHNNYALALAKAKKFPEAEAELTKAAQLDPTNAGKYYFNLGAVLVNTGQIEPAGDAFKKALTADPNYADAHFQYGVYLMSKAKTMPDGKIVPPDGTAEAFNKYLQLKPDGKDAEAAKGMLTAIGSTIQTQYSSPNRKVATPRKK